MPLTGIYAYQQKSNPSRDPVPFNIFFMQVPAGYEGDFLWVEYLKKTKSQAAPLSLFLHKDEYKHAFKVILSYILSHVVEVSYFSVLRIRDVYPGPRIRIFFHPGSELFPSRIQRI